MRACVRVGSCVRVRLLHWWTTQKRFEINPSILHHLVGNKKTFNDVLSDVVVPVLNLLLKVDESNRDHLDRLNLIISQTVTDEANITIVNVQEVAYWHSIDMFTFDLDPF